MVAIIVSAVLVCAGALVLGQAVLRICGFERWSWLCGPVGLAAAFAVAVLAPHLPGRATTTAVLLGVLVLASAAWVLRDRAMWPPIGGLIAAGPTAALALVPFAAWGRGGTLGVGFNNDMASHLLWGEGFRSAAVAAVSPLPPDYPLGAHALVATVAQGLGVEVYAVFAGLTVATAILIAWVAIAVFPPRLSWPAQILVATVAGLPFIVAGYYGQGSFKELLETLFVLGATAALVQRPERSGALRWVPVAFVAVGALSVYGLLGLPWIVGVLGAGLVVGVLRRAAAASLRTALADVGRGLPAALCAGVALLVVAAPQLGTLRAFFQSTFSNNVTGIPTNSLGNLAGRITVWPAFGMWDSADYRVGTADPFVTGMWTAAVIALVAVGVVWCIRRGEWALPIAALVAFVIWAVSDRTQSPYVAAKALVVLSPLLLLLAARPLIDTDRALPRWWRVVAPVLAVVLLVRVVDASVPVLRFSSVGPTDHLAELRSLRPILDGKRTMYLGNDDFIQWELAGVPAEAPVIGIPHLPINPEKPWVYGQALDIDSVAAETINGHEWVIAPRDGAASAMPEQLQLVRQTRSFDLWRRTGPVPPRSVLPEGDAGAALLKCDTRRGRSIVRGGGVALVRPPSRVVEIPPFPAGTSIGVDLALGPGTYDLSMPYGSPQPIEVQVVGHREVRMPASLERPGVRWPIGRVTIREGEKQPVRIGMYGHKRRLTSPTAVISPAAVVATPVSGREQVPIHRACGRLVDYFVPATPR